MAAHAGITRDAIAAAALAILDEGADEGALTMRALAERLGVRAPSLYAHVAGLDEVIGLVHAELNGLVDPRLAPDPTQDRAAVEASLRHYLRSYREAYRSHPVAAALIMSRDVNADHALQVYEPIAAALLGLGVEPARVMPLMAFLDAIVLGSAAEPFAAGFARRPAEYAPAYPALAAALAATDRPRIDDAGFALGLDAFFRAVRESALSPAR